MSRKELSPEMTDEVFNRLIDEYGSIKLSMNEMKKTSDVLNNQIKDIFRERNIIDQEYLTENNKAKVTVSYREKFDEEKAIEILRKELTPEDFSKAVRIKEYIDENALEELTFNKVFDASKLEKCIDKGEPVYTLRVDKLKKKKLMEDK